VHPSGRFDLAAYATPGVRTWPQNAPGARSSFVRTPARPPLDGLKKRLERSRAEREGQSRDGFLRETFVLPRPAARLKAKEWFDRFPKQAYWTEIESWFERPGDIIEFTMRRLPAAD